MSTDFAPDLASGPAAKQKDGAGSTARAARFLFDLSFDADAPQAPVEVKPITLPVAELEAIKAAMFEDGRNAGRAEALQQGSERAEAQFAQLTEVLQQLTRDGLSRAGSEVETISAAIKAIAQNLLPAYMAQHGFAELEGTVRECLSQLKGEPRLVIRTSEAELDEAIKRFETLATAAAFPGKLIILADPQLSPGDLRVEWADGGLERANGNLWAEVERILARGMTAASHTNTMNGDNNG